LESYLNLGQGGDISVIGINDIPMCTWWCPYLTTVAFNIPEIVQNTCEMLIEKRQTPSQITISPRLMIRDTVQ